jgi:predicted transcriptional regulator
MVDYIQRQRRQPKAKDISREVITLQPDKTLYDARNTLFIYNISRVVIAKDNKPLGIITEKDIAWYLYTEIPNRPLDQIRLDEIMSENLITVGDRPTALRKVDARE